jgi:hypothetical protein
LFFAPKLWEPPAGAVIKLDKTGELLREMNIRPGNPQLSHDTTIDRPKLEDLGISRDQSSRYQALT